MSVDEIMEWAYEFVIRKKEEDEVRLESESANSLEEMKRKRRQGIPR